MAMDRIDSEHFHTLIGMLKGMMVVLCMNHIIACAWYGLSTLTSDGVEAWIHFARFDVEDSFAYKYLTSLHWSLTQFTPASMEVLPRNIHERAFAVCVLIFALLVFSSFLSSITASMTQLRQLSWKFDKNLSVLRKYLRTHAISQTLSIRIMRYVEYKLQKKAGEVRESDVSLLRILSPHLFMELSQELHEPLLTQHPFFSHLAAESPSAMRALCKSLTAGLSTSAGDIVFSEFTKSESLIFLKQGSLLYCNKYQKGLGDTGVEAGQWCSEASLWTSWEHVGWLQARTNSELLLVSAASFVQVVREHSRIASSTLQYGSSFVQMLNKDGGKFVSDIHVAEDGVLEKFIEEAFAVSLETKDPMRAPPSGKTSRSLLQRVKASIPLVATHNPANAGQFSRTVVPA